MAYLALITDFDDLQDDEIRTKRDQITAQVSRINIPLIWDGIQGLRQKRSDAGTQKRIIEFVREAIQNAQCPICDHPASENEMIGLKEKLSRLENGTGK